MQWSGPGRAVLPYVMTTVLMMACATAGHLPQDDLGPAWPPPPEAARLVRVGELRGAADLDMEEGFGAAALRFLAGEATPELMRPYAVAVFGEAIGTGPAGGSAPGPARLAVTDTEARAVFLFDLEAGDTHVLETAGGAALQAPVAAAFDAGGRLYVCDSGRAEVLRFGPDGAFERVVAGRFERPAGLAVDRARGLLYVSDAGQHVVRRFDLEGRPRGAVAHSFAFPTHLAVDARGRLFISDSMGFQVVVVSPEGERLAAVGRIGDGSGDLQRPKGVAADSDGHIYVADAIFDNVQVFDTSGRLLLAAGSAGNGPGELALPAGVAVDERDLLYVADAYNGRVVILRYLRGGVP